MGAEQHISLEGELSSIYLLKENLEHLARGATRGDASAFVISSVPGRDHLVEYDIDVGKVVPVKMTLM